MGMMEVLVGAISGSIAGTVVGMPMLYIQTQMNRRSEIYQRSTKAISMAWDAAHEAERIITDELPDAALSDGARSKLRGVGSQLAQHGMLCLDNGVRERIEQCGHLLVQMGSPTAARQPETALAIARDAQFVCAAFLRHDRIPAPSSELAQYLQTARVA